MNAARQRLPPGSAPWIVSESQNADDTIANDVEDFGYAVRNELEWLNEHMADIFTAEPLNLANVFKTPGKLRGKTPRTARKRNVLGERAPLTDIFAPNSANRSIPSPGKHALEKRPLPPVLSYDQENIQATTKSFPTSRAQQKATDSGYHGTTDDEMEVDRFPSAVPAAATFIHEDADSDATQPIDPIEERRQTEEETYESARESLASPKAAEVLPSSHNDDIDMMDAENDLGDMEADLHEPVAAAEDAVETLDYALAPATSMDIKNMKSPSESPVHTLVRKSSLTFAALPGREPLLGKKSFGAQQGQRTSFAEQIRSTMGRSSNLGRVTNGKSLGGTQLVDEQQTADNDDQEDFEVGRPMLNRLESETTKLHNKTSTQRLHEKISMLGKSREVRSSKSIPSSAFISQQTLQQSQPAAVAEVQASQLENVSQMTQVATQVGQPLETHTEIADDDWIAPLNNKAPARPILEKSTSTESIGNSKPLPTVAASSIPVQLERGTTPQPVRPSPKKYASTWTLSSPSKASMAPEARKPVSVSNPHPPQAPSASYTPAGSPAKKIHNDGPLSASKAKLFSVLRSAKGIFASSAGVSAQAKMEVLATAPPKFQGFHDAPPSPTSTITSVPNLYPSLPPPEARRTRSSSEREQKRLQDEEKSRDKVTSELDKAREKERVKAAAHAAKNPTSRPASPTKSIRTDAGSIKERQDEETEDMPPPPPPKSLLPQTAGQRLREPRRIAKPVKEAPQQPQKIKLAPMSVRVPSQRAGQPQAAPVATAFEPESMPPPPPPKSAGPPPRPQLTTASSSGSLRGASSSQAAKKALEAAAKKREQDAKAAQRKAEQRRELELKRQARVEEEKRAEEQRRAEVRAEEQRKLQEKSRMAELKKPAAPKTALTKRLEQQREASRPPSRDQHHTDLATALQQDKVQAQNGHARGDLSNARPVARMPMVSEVSRPVVQINPAKPAKRALQADVEEEQQQQRPTTQRNPPSYQQMDAKRRKTNEEIEEPADHRRSVMAPPVRQSIIRKDNKYPYSHMPTGGPSQPHNSIFIKTVTNQHQLAHPKQPLSTQQDMSKYASNRIPFAEASNPPAGSMAPPSSQFKTPGRPLTAAGHHAHLQKSAPKSSPHYPPSESIALPEIMTDSEDEDSENEFQAPDWVNSPALRDLLTQQQLVDPVSIFGPIAPLHMEEVFKGSKKEKRFRDRTSSALWVNDRLTDEERRKDQVARERLAREGWRFEPEQ